MSEYKYAMTNLMSELKRYLTVKKRIERQIVIQEHRDLPRYYDVIRHGICANDYGTRYNYLHAR